MISVIIPTLNEEKIIGTTLSRLKKGFTIPHEIIVSDGGSRDTTVALARASADIVVEHTDSSRQNIAQGRNAGAAAAKGDFLVFLDADCSVHDPDRFFTTALENFNDPRIVAVTGWLGVEHEEARWADHIIFYILNSWMLFINNVLRMGASPGGEFQMVRAETFRSLGGYNERLIASEDIELFQRLARVGRTHMDTRLRVFHTGRRARKVGWPHLLSLWFLNTASMMFRKKAYVEEWVEVR